MAERDKIEGIEYSGSTSGSLRRYNPLELFFLLRFARLHGLREGLKSFDPKDWRIKLIDKALFSTYRDCAGLGLASDLQSLREKEGRDN